MDIMGSVEMLSKKVYGGEEEVTKMGRKIEHHKHLVKISNNDSVD